MLFIYCCLFILLHYKSCEYIKLMIVTFYNCDLRLYSEISSVLDLEMNWNVYIYILGFRARQHLRSLASVKNDE